MFTHRTRTARAAVPERFRVPVFLTPSDADLYEGSGSDCSADPDGATKASFVKPVSYGSEFHAQRKTHEKTQALVLPAAELKAEEPACDASLGKKTP